MHPEIDLQLTPALAKLSTFRVVSLAGVGRPGHQQLFSLLVLHKVHILLS